jgi:hypothetical protein
MQLAIELLGRSVEGEESTYKSNLRSGLKWLYNPLYPNCRSVDKNTIIITTLQKQYSINELEQLRNYAAHGQAVSAYYNIDYEIIANLHQLLKIALTSYWNEIKNNEELCNNLAQANIIPLRGLPILQFRFLLNENHHYLHCIGDAFSKFDKLFQI